MAAEREGVIGNDSRSNPTCTERKAEGRGNAAAEATRRPPVGGSSRGLAAGGRLCTRRSAGSDAIRAPATGAMSAAMAAVRLRVAAKRENQPWRLSTWSAGRSLDG